MDGQVSGLGTVHLLLTLNFLSTWILPLHVVSSALKRKSSSSVMDGLQRRRRRICNDTRPLLRKLKITTLHGLSHQEIIILNQRCKTSRREKMEETMLIIFEDLYRHAKHNVSKLVNTDRRQYYTVGIALLFLCKELHQLAYALSNRLLPKLLTIFASYDLPRC